jgi:hypothetical protein
MQSSTSFLCVARLPFRMSGFQVVLTLPYFWKYSARKCSMKYITPGFVFVNISKPW